MQKFNPIAYQQIVAHMLEHQRALMIQTSANIGTPPGVPPETTKVGVDE